MNALRLDKAVLISRAMTDSEAEAIVGFASIDVAECDDETLARALRHRTGAKHETMALADVWAWGSFVNWLEYPANRMPC